VLADLSPHAGYQKVTLEQLLRHRAGVPPGDDELRELRRSGLPSKAQEQRLRLARAILGHPPASPPDEKFEYSNAGYVLAGLMLERRTRQNWEDLMRRRLFEPLGMKTAGFGAPATAGKVDQPWGHLDQQPVAPGPRADNPPALGPAGTVHCSLADLARFGQVHLQAGKPLALDPATWQRLHGDGQKEEYALGWLRADRDWAGGTALTHTGSNTMFFAVIWLAPARKFGAAAATNAAGKAAIEACDAAVGLLIERYLAADSSPVPQK
jgi:CubicO group peptidase (beta-lactamase class C family)